MKYCIIVVFSLQVEIRNLEEKKMQKQIEQTITSLEVAEMVGKLHNDLLKDIRRYYEQLGEVKIPQSDFFVESTYQSSQNKTMPCFRVTKKGCEFIAHKLTGVKGTEFAARYIHRFHDMEEQLINPLEGISKELQAVIVVDKRVTQVEQKVITVQNELEKFKMDMPILGIEIDKITAAVHKRGVNALGGKDSNAYKNKSLRGKVYQDIYRELKRQFDVTTYKAIKRSQCEQAIAIVYDYELPLALQEKIEDCNAQINMGVA